MVIKWKQWIVHNGEHYVRCEEVEENILQAELSAGIELIEKIFATCAKDNDWERRARETMQATVDLFDAIGDSRLSVPIITINMRELLDDGS